MTTCFLPVTLGCNRFFIVPMKVKLKDSLGSIIQFSSTLLPENDRHVPLEATVLHLRFNEGKTLVVASTTAGHLKPMAPEIEFTVVNPTKIDGWRIPSRVQPKRFKGVSIE